MTDLYWCLGMLAVYAVAGVVSWFIFSRDGINIIRPKSDRKQERRYREALEIKSNHHYAEKSDFFTEGGE